MGRIVEQPASAPARRVSVPVCRKCGTSRWVVPGYKTKTPQDTSWMCERRLAKVKVKLEQARFRRRAS